LIPTGQHSISKTQADAIGRREALTNENMRAPYPANRFLAQILQPDALARQLGLLPLREGNVFACTCKQSFGSSYVG
jgi:hypothetical protein